MTNKTPKLIFVDGFNASGKDYAIEQICQELTDRGYEPLLGDPRYFLPKVIASKRFFTFKYFDKDVLNAIHNGHINALKDYVDKLSKATDKAVVVVNRSYLSTMIYNHVADAKSENFDEMIKLFVKHTLEYIEAYKEIMLGKPAVAVVLSKHYDCPECTQTESVELLKKKIFQRDGTTQFDDQYLNYLVRAYGLDQHFVDIGVPAAHTHSGSMKDFVNEHFPYLSNTSIRNTQ